jgi:hypothetical protein
MVALRKLITANRAYVFRQHGGMGKGATRDLDFVMNAELGLRSNPSPSTTGDAANPPSTPARQKIPTPEYDGIEYPTSDGYHQMTRSEKLKTTKQINLKRLERGMSKWTPPGTPSKRKREDQGGIQLTDSACKGMQGRKDFLYVPFAKATGCTAKATVPSDCSIIVCIVLYI